MPSHVKCCKVVYRHVMEELTVDIAMAFEVLNTSDSPNAPTNDVPPAPSEKQAAVNRAYSWDKAFAQKAETLVAEEINSRCHAISDNADHRHEKAVPDTKKCELLTVLQAMYCLMTTPAHNKKAPAC